VKRKPSGDKRHGAWSERDLNLTAPTMLRIDTEIVIALSGWMRREHLPELERVLGQARALGRCISLDLQDVSLADRESVEFVAASLSPVIRLRACPPYLREWMAAVERDNARNHDASSNHEVTGDR
jgi:hypothetical protein